MDSIHEIADLENLTTIPKAPPMRGAYFFKSLKINS
jgi:hypothetical protein